MECGSMAALSTSSGKSLIKTGTWSLAEDTRLRNAVKRHGKRWVLVAKEVSTRTGEQCAKRWNENLNPELDHCEWTSEEDEYLLRLVQTHGHNWKFMADNFLVSRAALSLKNRYTLLMRRLKRTENARRRSTGLSIPDHRPQLSRGGMDEQLSRISAPFEPSSSENSVMRDDRGFSMQINHLPSLSPLESPLSFNDIDPLQALMTPTTGSMTTTTELPPFTTSMENISHQSWQQQHPHHYFPAVSDSHNMPNISGNNSSSGLWNNEPSNGEFFEIQRLSLATADEGSRSSSSSTASHATGSDKAAPNVIKYSVACTYNTTPKVVAHLVHAAMSEVEERVSDHNQVVVTLQLRV